VYLDVAGMPLVKLLHACGAAEPVDRRLRLRLKYIYN
jgi:hypothetical protein